MGRRSVGAEGKGMSKAYFQRLAAGGVSKAPSSDELEAIARGIGRPPKLVKQAAASQWLGLEIQELSGYDEDVRHIVVRVADMDPQERKRWRAMIEAAGEVE
jgi:DNA primase